MRWRFFGLMFLGLAAILAVVLFAGNSVRTRIPVVFSTKQMLGSLWEGYKQEYWESATGRTIDTEHQNITTSEGQSYTMLRAVWMDDKKTFDATWAWTQKNLERSDRLFSWVYGKRQDGTYGILSNGGENAASDADTDIALALIFAAQRWGENAYRDAALAILKSIWDNEVVFVRGIPVLTADNIEKESTTRVLVNPSYFSPAAYRIFGQIDRTRPWNDLARASYEILRQAMAARLDARASAGLPPDWIAMDRATGELSAPEETRLTTEYRYDAMRIPWRIGLDAAWFNTPDAYDTLGRMGFLGDAWKLKGTLASEYAHDGRVVNAQESPAFYGGAIAYFMFADQGNAEDVYETKLKSLYNPDTQRWKTRLSYYDDNWAWFGIGLYTNYLINLAPGRSVLRTSLL